MSEARRILEELDREVAIGLSLDAARPRARSLAELGELILPEAGSLALPLARGLTRVVRSVRAAFPDNIFCDIDYLAVTLFEQARRDGPDALEVAFDRIERLQALFGGATAIRFRYVHDFFYGFDWAKWVARDPAARAGIGPFDPRFLEHLEQRGHELLRLIAQGDAEYGPLAGPQHRNPFGFSRDPEQERALHRDLAARGWIPVEAWRLDARPRWDRPYADERRARARALGIATE